MGFGEPGSPPDRSRYFDIQSRQLDPNSQEWTELVPGATPYDMLEFRKFDDPYFRGDPSNETVDQYYTAAVKQSDDSKYNIYDPDTGDVTGYDEQAYFADLYNIGDEFGQGYFIDREEKEYTDSGDFAGYNYFLAQQEGYEALAPDYSAYDPQPEPEPEPDPEPSPPTPEPEPDPEPPTPPTPPTPEPPEPPEPPTPEPEPPPPPPPEPEPEPEPPTPEPPTPPPEPEPEPEPSPPGSPTNPITPRQPYVGLEVDDEERGRPRRGRQRSRTIMTGGLIGGAPVSRKTLLGS